MMMDTFSVSELRLSNMMKKESVQSLKQDLSGKRVLVRVDLNVPLNHKYEIYDDSKIRAAVPTISHLMIRKARVILASHLGIVGVDDKYTMKLLLPRLSELLGTEVKMANDCIGQQVEDLVTQMSGGEVLLLENVKFHQEEEMSNAPEFAKKLASLADLFVNDALAIAPRKYASTVGVTNFLKPAVAGLLMHKELELLIGAIQAPNKPLVAIFGGSRLSTKVRLIDSVLGTADVLLLGGSIISAFYMACEKSSHVGSSQDASEVENAKYLIEKANKKGKVLVLPEDVVIADMFGPKANTKVNSAIGIPNGWMGLDIGPKTIESFCNVLNFAKTVIWNGPMGVYEYDLFNDGTKAIAEKLAELSGQGVETIIAGGDTVAAVQKLGLADRMSHISTGDRGSLALLAGEELPGVLVLDESVHADS